MRKSRFTEEQIIKALKEHASGVSAGDLCRKYGISDATFYKWRSRYGGMEIFQHFDPTHQKGHVHHPCVPIGLQKAYNVLLILLRFLCQWRREGLRPAQALDLLVINAMESSGSANHRLAAGYRP